MKRDGFLKIGHRGAAGYGAENTLASFGRAVYLGANALELDVRAAQDGEIVVFHDSNLRRLAGRNEAVKDLAYEDLRRIPIGSGQAIPTLKQVLEIFGGSYLINIELKETGIASRVLRLIRECNLIDSVMVSAFAKDENRPDDSSTWQDLFWMKAQESGLKIALLAGSYQWMLNGINAAGDGGGLPRDNPFPIYALCLNGDLVGEATLRAIRGRTKCRVLVYTVNDPVMIQWYKEQGVDGIFSDFPDRL